MTSSNVSLPPLPTAYQGDLCVYQVVIGTPDGSVDPEFSQGACGLHNSITDAPALYINSAMPEWWRWQTFFHEVLHSIEEEMALDLKDGKTGEVERLALGLYRAWRRNGWKLPGE